MYFSPNIIWVRMIWARHVVCIGQMRNVYIISVGEPEGKRPLGGPRRRWEEYSRMDLREIGWEILDWMHLAQERTSSGRLWTR